MLSSPDYRRTPMCEYFANMLATKVLVKRDVRQVAATSLSDTWIFEHGLDEPLLLEGSTDDLGMSVPDKPFDLYTVAREIGLDYPVKLIEVGTQSEILGKSLSEYASYLHDATNKHKIINMISLEFSKTPLSSRVIAPSFVRHLDWCERYWPKTSASTDTNTDYPAVQKYCLAGMAGSYTDFHVDFGGTSVWYHVMEGCKRFYVIPPTCMNLHKYEKWVTSSNQDKIFFGNEVGSDQLTYIDLYAGMTMIIPAGWIHAVYTPEKSLVFGGNFLYSGAMYRQLQVFMIEDNARVARRYRFPYYFRMLGYSIIGMYCEVLQLDDKCSSSTISSNDNDTHNSFITSDKILPQLCYVLKYLSCWMARYKESKSSSSSNNNNSSSSNNTVIGSSGASGSVSGSIDATGQVVAWGMNGRGFDKKDIDALDLHVRTNTYLQQRTNIFSNNKADTNITTTTSHNKVITTFEDILDAWKQYILHSCVHDAEAASAKSANRISENVKHRIISIEEETMDSVNVLSKRSTIKALGKSEGLTSKDSGVTGITFKLKIGDQNKMKEESEEEREAEEDEDSNVQLKLKFGLGPKAKSITSTDNNNNNNNEDSHDNDNSYGDEDSTSETMESIDPHAILLAAQNTLSSNPTSIMTSDINHKEVKTGLKMRLGKQKDVYKIDYGTTTTVSDQDRNNAYYSTRGKRLTSTFLSDAADAVLDGVRESSSSISGGRENDEGADADADAIEDNALGGIVHYDTTIVDEEEAYKVTDDLNVEESEDDWDGVIFDEDSDTEPPDNGPPAKKSRKNSSNIASSIPQPRPSTQPMLFRVPNTKKAKPKSTGDSLRSRLLKAMKKR
jgi:hypothetical protein